MSSKIAFIIGGEFLCSNITEVLSENNYSYDVMEAPYNSKGPEFVEIAQNLIHQGVEIIVSTGVNGKYLMDHIDIPVILIKRSYYSFANAINLALRKSSKIAIIGRNGQYMQTALKNLSIFPHEILHRGFDSVDEIPDIINDILKHNIEVVIGTASVLALSETYGLKCIAVPFEEIDVLNAVYEANNHLRLIENNIKYNKTLEILVNSSTDGIIYLSNDGIINEINKTALEIIGESKEKVINQHIKNTPLRNIVNFDINNTKYSSTSDIVEINKVLLTLIKFPVIIENNIQAIILNINKVESIAKMDKEIRTKLLKKGHTASNSFRNIIGNSSSLNETIKIAKKYSTVDSTVLILGESGSGKEIFAQSIHNASKRKNEPFVVINCAALPESILESELFGYEKGAFTGSRNEGKRGLFELAHGGTVFLDEISEMPLSVQSRFLRVLQEKEVMPLGSNKVIPINVRIIAATNKKLEEMVANNEFRNDLYYRISVLILSIPPLRDRKDDVLQLSKYFLYKKNQELDLNILGFSNDALNYLSTLSYPGNVRELSNIVERSMIISSRSEITLNDVINSTNNKNILDSKHDKPSIDSLENKEIKTIKETLISNNYHRKKTAETLGISTTTLWRKMKKYNI